MSIVKASFFEPYIPSRHDSNQNVFLQYSYNQDNDGDIFLLKKKVKSMKI
jgi:hypothetical protein